MVRELGLSEGLKRGGRENPVPVRVEPPPERVKKEEER